jgi:hypothetical protein
MLDVVINKFAQSQFTHAETCFKVYKVIELLIQFYFYIPLSFHSSLCPVLTQCETPIENYIAII